MSGLGSVSLNMVWNPAIRGSNFLQASMKGIHTYAKSVTKANLLKSTNFPLLKRNLRSTENHLGQMRSQVARISATPLNLNTTGTRDAVRSLRTEMSTIERSMHQTAFYSRQNMQNMNRTNVPRGTPTTAPTQQQRVSGGASVATAVGVGAMMTIPFKASIEFESSMADVKALTKDITAEDFTLLTAKAKTLGATTEWSASQAAIGMTFLAKAGFDTKQQLGAMNGVLGLATAGSVELGVSSDIASNILSGFSIKATEMGTVADVLAKTFTTSNTDLIMLGETMKYTAPIASGLGVGLTEVSALAGKLGDVGIQGSMAGTSLRTMYTRLSAPPTDARKAIEALGLSVFDAGGKFRGMPNIIGQLNSSMKTLNDGQKTEKLKALFGMEALSSGIALMKVGKKGLLSYKSTLDNATGTTKKIQDIKLDTTKGQFKLLASAMEGLSISATTGLLPMLGSITNGFTSGATILDNFTQKFPNASKYVFGLGAALVVGTVALAGFGFVASGVATAVGFISLPILGVVGAVGALGGAGYYLYTSFAGVRDVVGGLGSTLGSLFGGIKDIMLPLASTFGSAFVGIGSSIMEIARPVGSLLMGIGGLLGGFKTLGIIAKGVGWVIGSAFTIITSPILAVVKIIQGALGAVSWLVSSVSGLLGFTTEDITVEKKIDKKIDISTTMPKSNLESKSTFLDGAKSFFGFGSNLLESKKTDLITNTIDTKTNLKTNLLANTTPKNTLPGTTTKDVEKSGLWSMVKGFFSSSTDVNTANIPINNLAYNSSLTDIPAIPQVAIESVSSLTDRTLAEQKLAEQTNNTNSAKQQIVQNITQNIQVTADKNGEVNYEDLKEKIKRAMEEIKMEDEDLSLADLGA